MNTATSIGPLPLPSATIVRIATGVLLGIHGWSRLLTGGYVPFGEYLDGKGIPFGSVVALAITLFEICGSCLLVVRRLVIPVAVGHGIILASGIVMVHASEGWFVVGRGRNGVEYSLLLLACLLSVIQAERESKGKARLSPLGGGGPSPDRR